MSFKEYLSEPIQRWELVAYVFTFTVVFHLLLEGMG
jgi:hypothetical protein